MKSAYRKQYVTGILLTLVVVIVLLRVFSMLCRTDKVDLYLGDTASKSYGWSYEILSDGEVSAVTPEFADEYSITLPGEPAEAVKITRIFTETLPYASLELYIYGAGVEVFVDERLLYSDFGEGARNEAGFLLLTAEETERLDPEEGRSVSFSLPEEYTGKTLTVITYFAEGGEGSSPVYPSLGNSETVYASFVTGSVFSVAILVLCAILVVLISVLFVLDLPNGKADGRLLLLSLSFLLLFLGKAYGSILGTASLLSEHMNLSFLENLYMAPLLLFLALHLTGWRKYLLSAGVILWFLYEGIRMFLNARQGLLVLTGRKGAGAFILFIAVAAAFLLEYICRRRELKKKITTYQMSYGIMAVMVSILRLLYGAQEWQGDVGMYVHEIFFTASKGHFYPFVYFFADICGIMAMLIVMLEFIRRTIRTKGLLGVLEERARLTLEGYNRMLRAEDATNAVRHEMRHHMVSLMGILKEGDTGRACEYISSVTGRLDALPVFRYSQNLLVNVIAGEYLDRAAAQGILVEHSLAVPADVKIADEDLSVLLTNMLENALEACERMEAGRDRYIRVKMYVYDNFLFIGCVNSCLGQSEEPSGHKRDRKESASRSHGYGMAAMSGIAEKYNSILKVEQGSGEFSVKTNLCLRGQKN